MNVVHEDDGTVSPMPPLMLLYSWNLEKVP